MATAILGLTLRRVRRSLNSRCRRRHGEDFDSLEFCGILTPGLAARVLRGLPDGVLPSFMWDELASEDGLEGEAELMEETLEQGRSENGDFSSGPEGHRDSIC